ncbi:MAG: amino acid adenylation domain-containing protein [Gammaproteobacteria bacterium]|nr:amino acid adenylation domain-containing protein [Gammaproteobacteria bacterium]
MNLLTAILQQVEEYPDAVALQDDTHELSYQSLALKIGAVCLAIRKAGVTPESRIALAMDRGIDATCALLGILAAGCCYVPLDINSPEQRQQFIVEDAQAAGIIGTGQCPSRWSNCNWIDFNTLTEHDCQFPDTGSTPLAAILYTSGSTGQPKGVALSHRAILAFTQWATHLLALNSKDRIASLAPLYFDLSTFDIFSSLAAGASIDFVPKQLAMAPSRLSAWLAERNITGFYTVPSVLGFMALKGNLAETPLPALRVLLFAGEVFQTEQLKRLVEFLPQTRFYNFYGPTETNVCLYWPVDAERLVDLKPIPIGKPASQNQVKMNPDNGELLVKGPTVMNGYWNEGRLHPATDDDGWYATGDQVSINNHGEYCYHGRLDRMMKCSGYRVEPVEIERAIQNLDGVQMCAVIGIHDETAGQRPAAVIVANTECSIQNLRKTLATLLPAYMIPSRWKTVPALPLMANGKIDYSALDNLFA